MVQIIALFNMRSINSPPAVVVGHHGHMLGGIPMEILWALLFPMWFCCGCFLPQQMKKFEHLVVKSIVNIVVLAKKMM